MSDETETCVVARGPLATRIVETVDQVEPELATFLRDSARRLDPAFPQSGQRGQGKRGQLTGDDGVKRLFTEVEELDSQGRGIRTVRTLNVGPEGGPHECAIWVTAVGLANDAKLTVRWDFITTAQEVRGLSAALFVQGLGTELCIAAFRELFDVPTS